MSLCINADDVKEAGDRIKAHVHRTPVGLSAHFCASYHPMGFYTYMTPVS